MRKKEKKKDCEKTRNESVNVGWCDEGRESR